MKNRKKARGKDLLDVESENSLQNVCSVTTYLENSEEDRVKLALQWLEIREKEWTKIMKKEKFINITWVRKSKPYTLCASFYTSEFDVIFIREYMSKSAVELFTNLIGMNPKNEDCSIGCHI